MHPTVLILLVVTGLVKETQAGAYMEFWADRYSDTCREDFNTSPCDPYYRLCVDRPRADTYSGWPCAFARTDKSGYFQDTNVINFSTMSDIKGIPNPLKVYISKLLEPSVTYVLEVYDDDYFEDDYMQIFGTIVKLIVYPSKAEAQWAYKTMTSGDYFLSFYVRTYCEDNYYTEDCSKYCLASDTSAGHFMCDKNTGNKICKPGWQEPYCVEDVNECDWNICHGGDCTNLPGDYSCTCPPNYSGKNCSVYTDPCGSHPCLNNAACITYGNSYRCHCDDGWEGDYCDVKTDPCGSMPCQNGMQCISSNDSSSYWCDCQYPTTGVNCESFITSKVPSQSPDISVSQSQGTSTPHNTGLVTKTTTTTARTPDESNLNGTAQHMDGVTESKDEEGFKWYIIVIILIILVIILCAVIILILCIRRRRRAQRNSPAGFRENFEHGAGRLAFENSAYSESQDPSGKKKNSPLNPVFTISERTGAQEPKSSKEITTNDQKIKKASDDIKHSSKETLRSEPMNKDNFLNLKRLTIISENNEPREENHYATVDEMASSVRRLNDNLQKNANQDSNDDDASSICSSCISEGLLNLPDLTTTPDQQNEASVYSILPNVSPDDGTYRTPKSTPA